MFVSAVILNGGSARRMDGVDKAWLEVSGEAILLRQLRILKQRTSEIALVMGNQKSQGALPLPHLTDRIGGLGPLDGIASGLHWSPSDWLLVVACDMPYINLVAIDVLLQARDTKTDIVAAISNSRVQPLFALYRKRVLPALDLVLEKRNLRASAFLQNPPSSLRVKLLHDTDFPDASSRAFDNVNTPEDLKELVPIDTEIE